METVHLDTGVLHGRIAPKASFIFLVISFVCLYLKLAYFGAHFASRSQFGRLKCWTVLFIEAESGRESILDGA